MDLAGLIVGLGNPGKGYVGTRHNMGFVVVQALLEELARTPSCALEALSGAKFSCRLWRCPLPASRNPWLIAMPDTFMNLSGDAVQPLMAWHKLEPGQLLVVHDELDLEPGRLKLKTGGGVAGHNGLKSIAGRLGTPEFHRLRIGVGRPPSGANVVPWVLGGFNPTDRQLEEKMIPDALDAIFKFASLGPVRAANAVNTKKASCEAQALSAPQ